MKNQLVFLILSVLVLVVSAWGLRTRRDLSIPNESESPCQCSNYDCGCCEHVDLGHVGLDATVCTNFSYLPKDYGVSVTITWNSWTLFNETISARNPPPFCFGIPELEKMKAHICLRLYDLTFGDKHFHGCGKLSISVYHIIHRSVNLGCFNIPKAPLAKALTTESRNMLDVIRDHLESLEFWKNSVPEVNMI